MTPADQVEVARRFAAAPVLSIARTYSVLGEWLDSRAPVIPPSARTSVLPYAVAGCVIILDNADDGHYLIAVVPHGGLPPWKENTKTND